MLNRLTRATRLKAARVLVALYALCLVLPVAGLVFATSAVALQCLPDVVQVQHAGHQHGNVQGHAHEGHAHHGHVHQTMADDAGAMNDHVGINDHTGTSHLNGKSTVPACCGVMCVTALPANLFELLPRTVKHASIVTFSDAGISGDAPDRLYRPPIVLLSL